MEDFLGSLLCLYCVWILCKNSSCCSYACLNRRFHITVHHKLLENILLRDLSYSSKEQDIQAQHQMGIVGILAYITLFPTALYIWIADGKFNFYIIEATANSIWYTILFICVLVLSTLDFWIGYFFIWRESEKERQKCRNPSIPNDIRWAGTESKEEKCCAKKVFCTPDRIIWDMDVQEFYYLKDKLLLRLRANGTFVSLSADSDSPCVLKAMRTGRFIKF